MLTNPGRRRTALATVAIFLVSVHALPAQRQMEALNRGVVALRTSETEVFVGWRLLGIDALDVAFNVYRATDGGAPTLLNSAPLTAETLYVDTEAPASSTLSYTVKPVINTVEGNASEAFTLAAGSTARNYLSVPLSVPAGGTTPDSVAYTYSANDASVGDLDGDSDYEIVLKWDPSNSQDNSVSGYTSNVYLDAYELDGTQLWRIDLGVNIRAGAHYTQFMVYDLDGDGRAEVACRTAEGSKDGLGNYVADETKFSGTRPTVDHTADHRDSSGYILSGPEFLTLFDGLTGEELVSTPYVPSRHPTVEDPTTSQIREVWGDNYGNRMDRFLACVAYLDGERPSLVMCRGYYLGQSSLPGRTVLAAWNWRDDTLTSVWVFDTWENDENDAYRGQGNHSLTVADVDGDGRDEIVYGACAIDDDGTGLYSTGYGHGDALHVSQMSPDRPGLLVFQPHESSSLYGANALSLVDACTGELVMGVAASGDIGRGLAADVDPRYPGYEFWGTSATGGMYTVSLSTEDATNGPRAVQIASSRPSVNFAVWWDGDLLRELLDGTTVTKWNWESASTSTLLSPSGVASNNGTKATPCLQADLFGDWREEIVLHTTDSSELRIFSTTDSTTYRIPTLMHDPQYRLAVTWQNVAYNQPPHPGYFLGDGMAGAPTPDISAGAPDVDARLTNLSVRTYAGTASETLILGCVINGSTDQSLLARGVGPRLADFGVEGCLADPRLDLFERVGTTETWLDGIDDWWTASNADEVATISDALWAFPLYDGARDAALLTTLPAGVYTFHVSPASGDTGIALAEIYAASEASTAQLINASARAYVGTGEGVLIVGFVISGTTNKTVLLRAGGPTLAGFGVDGVLEDPRLDLYKRQSDNSWKRLTGNDDWDDGSGTGAQVFARSYAYAFESGLGDAALLLHLSPGVYTAHASGVGSTTGVGLVEIYDLEP